MTSVSGSFKNYNIPRGAMCPDFSTGNSITLEHYAQKTLEKALDFRQSIVEERLNENYSAPDALDEWFLRANVRIKKVYENGVYNLNKTAESNAQNVLKILRERNILPSLINPTSDESILFEFFLEDNYFSIDFYNSGEIVYLHQINNLPAHVTELDIKDISEIATEIAQTQASLGL